MCRACIWPRSPMARRAHQPTRSEQQYQNRRIISVGVTQKPETHLSIILKHLGLAWFLRQRLFDGICRPKLQFRREQSEELRTRSPSPSLLSFSLNRAERPRPRAVLRGRETSRHRPRCQQKDRDLIEAGAKLVIRSCSVLGVGAALVSHEAWQIRLAHTGQCLYQSFTNLYQSGPVYAFSNVTSSYTYGSPSSIYGRIC